MANRAARILMVEVKDIEGEPQVLFRFGVKELMKPIPAGHSFVRACAILDNDGNLTDCELITEKLQ